MKDLAEEIAKLKRTRELLPKGKSYALRVRAVNDVYDEHVKDGISNREIWRRYVYPLFGISERTFYSYLKRTFE